MNWFYVENGQQRGPVSDADLANLTRTGVIQPDTLVWREGMADWQHYSKINRGNASTSSAAPGMAS